LVSNLQHRISPVNAHDRPHVDPEAARIQRPGSENVNGYPVLARNLAGGFVHVGIACLALRNVAIAGGHAAAVVDAAKIFARLGVGHSSVAFVASAVAVVPVAAGGLTVPESS
jgi:hypothetical protein